MASWQRKLKALGACEDAQEWAAGYKTFPAAWKACARADWMLWLAVKIGVKRQTVVLALVQAIRPYCLQHSKDPRVTACLDTCEKWAHGKATIDEMRQARAAADAAASAAYAAGAAYAADAAASAAAYAADDAAYAADAAAYAAASAAAAAYAADAAAAAAARKAMAESGRRDLGRAVKAAWSRRGRA